MLALDQNSCEIGERCVARVQPHNNQRSEVGAWAVKTSDYTFGHIAVHYSTGQEACLMAAIAANSGWLARQLIELVGTWLSSPV